MSQGNYNLLTTTDISLCDNSSVEQVNHSNVEHNRIKFYVGVLAFAVISLLIVFINLRVICIVTDVPRRKLKPLSILVAHLSVVVLGSSFLLGLYIVEKLEVIGVASPELCPTLSFLRSLVYGVYPLNIALIIYECQSTFRERKGTLLVTRAVCLMWVIGISESIPTIFMAGFEKKPGNLGKCKQNLLFGSVGASLIYALFRFVVTHLVIVGYMLFALFQIRSKIKFLFLLQQIPRRRIQQTVRRLRFICIYSMLFIFLWLPIGFAGLGYGVLGRAGQVNFSTLWKYITAFYVLHYTFMMVGPIVFLYLNEDVKEINWFAAKCCCRLSNRGNNSTENIEVDEQNDAIEVEANEPQAV